MKKYIIYTAILALGFVLGYVFFGTSTEDSSNTRNTSDISESAHNHWMLLEKELKSSTTSIPQTADIKTQRKKFVHLSAHLINALKTFGINQKVYVDFCPMANNNVGAYWLSDDKEIRIPYFGASMMTCGDITDEIN